MEVLLNHYVTVRDSEMRSASNRTYERLLASLSLETAKRYGYQPEDAVDDLRVRLRTAESRNDWETVQKLAAELRNRCG